MQKVLDFLEKNVQWLVLGMAGVVFLLMVWMYVLSAPVTVEAGGQKLAPGEIEVSSGGQVRVSTADTARGVVGTVDITFPSRGRIAGRFSAPWTARQMLCG